jgi:hypothetical protein
MKLMKIIGYLMVIVVLEGALQEYHRVSLSHAHGYHVDHHDTVSHERQKESVPTSLKLRRTGYAWYELIMVIIQSLWALVIGVAQSIWHTIRTWIELILIVFECSELVHKLSDRFNLWAGLPQIKIW